MVTTVVNAVTAVTSPVGMPAGAEAAAAGQGDSEFAQLLDGMDGDAAVLKLQAGSVTAAKLTLTETDTTTADVVGLSAEMLALCATPMATPTPVPASTSIQTAIPILIAAEPTGQSIAADATAPATVGAFTAQPVRSEAVATAPTVAVSAPNNNADARSRAPAQDVTNTPVALAADSDVATTNATVDGAPVANTESGASTALTRQDMQWLRSGNQVVSNEAKPARQATGGKVSSAASALTAAVATSESATSAVQPSPVQQQSQDSYQQLLTQTAPMVAMATGQRYGHEIDKAADERSGISLEVVPASNMLAAQPAGTQLATDAAALDVSPRHQLHASVGSHQWATELGNKLTMMATKDTQSATLYMTPADLGPVQVRIDLHQKEASVWFTADHAETRSALEQSLPRLRDMFTAQGMTLTDAGVFGDRSRQQSSYNGTEQGNSSVLRFAGDEVSESSSSVRGISLSLLDAYA